ncbi:MAG: hypothetical protein Tsb002_05950 [Wenzhouxiangellaceae bacterium]
MAEEEPINPKEPEVPNKPPNIATIVIAAIIGGVIGYLICHFVADDSAAADLPVACEEVGGGEQAG